MHCELQRPGNSYYYNLIYRNLNFEKCVFADKKLNTKCKNDTHWYKKFIGKDRKKVI